jgi:DNA (cytosine-5)-methyltransferase 1
VKYLSVCSGIEAATVAWHPLGWDFAYSEIEAFPAAVLAHHYPNTPNFGDMTKFKEWPHATIDLLVGGTPCQSFSVAGLRKGLDDPRGNLMLTYLAIAAKYRPTWLVWENVPGVLSSNGGRDFGTFLAGLGQLGYGFAYRVLDAQYFGVAQRRRRVFVVGCLGDWRRAAAVLFERHSLSGNPAPRREAGKAAPTIPSRSTAGGGLGTDFDLDGGLIRCADVAPTLNAAFGSKLGLENQHIDSGAGMFVTHSLRGEGFDASEAEHARTNQLLPIGFAQNQRDEVRMMEIAGALAAEPGAKQQTYCLQHAQIGRNDTAGPGGKGWQEDVAFTMDSRSAADVVDTPIAWSEELTPSVDVAGTIQRGGSGGRHDGVLHAMQVRRLTPRECERLQGFPDDYTLIPGYNSRRTGVYGGNHGVPDGPRYKALGNSMAVPVMHWIGRRIDLVSAITKLQRTAA